MKTYGQKQRDRDFYSEILREPSLQMRAFLPSKQGEDPVIGGEGRIADFAIRDLLEKVAKAERALGRLAAISVPAFPSPMSDVAEAWNRLAADWRLDESASSARLDGYVVDRRRLEMMVFDPTDTDRELLGALDIWRASAIALRPIRRISDLEDLARRATLLGTGREASTEASAPVTIQFDEFERLQAEACMEMLEMSEKTGAAGAAIAILGLMSVVPDNLSGPGRVLPDNPNRVSSVRYARAIRTAPTDLGPRLVRLLVPEVLRRACGTPGPIALSAAIGTGEAFRSMTGGTSKGAMELLGAIGAAADAAWRRRLRIEEIASGWMRRLSGLSRASRTWIVAQSLFARPRFAVESLKEDLEVRGIEISMGGVQLIAHQLVDAKIVKVMGAARRDRHYFVPELCET